ncbi:succinyldiaminopimelate transaminase [Nonomuraea sp. NPDC050404]|uniref:succinyldiaminopimelate transaminase n=1 Tax=Nonomuraea sp. NPDC050404 TaxID=3155783 RepID=UPI0033CFFC68
MNKLPDFPWDRLEPYKERALAHPDGIVDLSIGTPVDPVPQIVQNALAQAANSPGYPFTHGTKALREAAAGWLGRRHGVTVDQQDVLPLIGSKEFVAWLPTYLGAKRVVFPELAYPTYDVGARLAGAHGTASDSTLALGPEPVDLIWVNSPGNPTGRVLPAEHLRKVVAWARERGAVVASDECYIELGWEERPVSILYPDVCGGSHEGLLAVHSLSKRSNLAGYRAGFVTGDPVLVKRLLETRKHAGMLMPQPVQAAMAVAFADDGHAEQQRELYAARRALLRPALEKAGWSIDHSTAGLYLWATNGQSAWDQVGKLSENGILVAPGEFYGSAGGRHIRIAVTATDERIGAAVRRLQ